MPHLNIQIALTEEEMKTLEKVAEERYKGKGITHFIFTEIQKRYGKNSQPCDGLEQLKRKGRHFEVQLPQPIYDNIICRARSKSTRPGALIAREIITPAIMNDLKNTEG